MTEPTSGREQRQEVRSRIVQQLPLLFVLVVLWMLLWGAVSWLNLVTGVILAFLVTRVFYLPPVELSGRFNPLWLAVFLCQFFYELFVASFQVALLALRPRRVSQNSIIEVQLRTRSDLIMTVVAIAMSLVPGSFVIESDRMRSRLYFHALHTEDLKAVEGVRTKALQLERLLVRSFGSVDDIERTGQ